MNERKFRTGGVIGTILFHAILLLCFIFFGFSSPLPPPPEQGIEVNLGYSDDGMGDIQPETPATDDASAQQSVNGNEDVSTQNTEETASLDKKNDQKQSQNQDNPVNKNALYSGKNKSNGGNEGETGKQGDQGNPNGDPNAKNHYGTPGSGISYNLDGRQKKSLPKPEYQSREEGIVVVSIWVDKNGNVTKAISGARGSTTTNAYLLKIAKDAAMKAKFYEKADAPEEQKGTITYNFINLN
jgi:TonB family protein